jgi:hypothetical protein
LNKIEEILIWLFFPYKTLGEVKNPSFVQELHPRINPTTLFFTKTYLLNTFNPISGHEN